MRLSIEQRQQKLEMEDTAFAHIVSRLRQKAMTTARSCGLDEMQADDMAQDAMLKLWNMRENLDRYRSLEALTVVVTRHLISDSRRKEQPSSMPDDMAYRLPATGNTPQEELEDVENDLWLQQQLALLPNKQQEVLRMRQVEHREYDEIAQILGINLTSARTLLARARKSLLENFKHRMQQS